MADRQLVEIPPSEFVQRVFMLNGEPFSIEDYPYLKAVYNSSAREIGLFTARQIAKCGPKSCIVTAHDGWLTTIGDVQPGDRVASVTPDFRPNVSEVAAIHANGRAECVEVRTKGGAVLRFTHNHRLRTALGYTEAGGLRPGDALACAETAGVFEDAVADRTRIILTAYMLGDGCCGKSGNWSVTSECPAVLAECRDLVPADTRTGGKAGTAAKTVSFRVAAPIRAQLEEDGIAGKYSYEKAIPRWVFKLSRQDTALFVSRLWATDGSINKQGQTVNVDYTSTSEQLARQVQSLIRKFGIRSTLDSFIPTCDGESHRRAWRVRVAGYDAVLRFYSQIGPVPGKPALFTSVKTERRSTLVTLPPEVNALLRAAYAPVSAIPKRRRRDGIHRAGLKWSKYRLSYAKFHRFLSCYRELGLDVSSLEQYVAGGVWWDTVESVTAIGPLEVFDLEVPGDSNYLADTGIVSHNSTTISSMLVANSVTKPNSSQILVSPLQEQAVVFSTTRLKDFIYDSPIVKNGFFTGAGVIDQVLRKQFNNGAIITLGYAQRTADRLRGRSILGDSSILGFDEIQDIVPDVIPVIKEMAFRTKNPRFLFAGTPKSMNNHMEGMRRRSTGSEWAVRCQATGCKKWNLEWDEKNIGDRGVICRHCGAPLDTNHNAQWVARRHLDIQKGKDAQVTMESYRIPQLIVKPIMDDPYKWIELLGKLRTYSTEKFRNEVLGLPHDSGSQPVTLDQLQACCVEDRPNVPPVIGSGNRPPLVMGVDWAFTAENSFTFVTIGAWNPFPTKFELYYWKIYKGVESNSTFQIEDIIRLYQTCGCRLIGADWGAGHVQNLQLVEALGEEHVAQMWHTGMRGKAGGRQRAKWEPKTRKWHLARTAVLTDTFETVKRQQATFPRATECGDLFKHILAESLEFNELINTSQYSNVDPDDGLHSLTYCMLAAELLISGDFRGHSGIAPVHAGAAGKPDLGDVWNDEAFAVGQEYYGG